MRRASILVTLVFVVMINLFSACSWACPAPEEPCIANTASTPLIQRSPKSMTNDTIANPSDEWCISSYVEHNQSCLQKERSRVAFDDFEPLMTPVVGPLANSPVGPSPTADHWWVIDYWDTTSGGSLPSYMTGEFIAEANTFGGLQSGWDGLTPWADAVLYLPLNVAYGTSSTNCVWFQFDIQFSQQGLSWPFPNAIEWYIWDIRGPGTSDSDYQRTSIGIDYVVGHHYWFALIPSGTNTITFYLTDQTTATSWSKNDWHWSIPSTNMLADESMFSPASCVEGYTTSSTLSGTPFLQTVVGETITVNRYYPVGSPIPSGIDADRISIGSYNLWYWMMLTPGSRPDPSISSVTYPSSVDVGEPAIIEASATNNGGVASWQTIAISFPSWEPISSINIIQSDLTSYGIHYPGETVSAAYGITTLSLDNYLVEGVAYWPQGVTHNLKISVTPANIGSFLFYVKSVAAAKNFASNWDPKSGTKDQQLEFVYNYTIGVGVNPSSISIGVNPSQIALGSGTTISGTIGSSAPGDFSGTVYLQYSTDYVNWNNIGSTSSSSSGYYSYWWAPSSAGSFYVRSYWNGNGYYGGATSSSVTLTVTSGAGNLGDHTMCENVQASSPYDPISRTSTFYTDDYAAFSWLHFNGPIYGSHTVHWDWIDPNGWNWADSDYTIPNAGDYGYDYWDWYRTSAGVFIDGYQSWYASRLGSSFQTKVYYDGSLVVTETWQVIKHGSSVSVSLSSTSIAYGQSVTVSSQIAPSYSDGTTTLQYSTDGVNWKNIASGTPSNGYYSNTWTPPAATTYYIRATWSGNLNYYDSTSSTQTLTVNRAATTLTTTLSATTISYGESVTITASMAPQLQGRLVQIQYGVDDANWYFLSSGTTNSNGQYDYSWTPAIGTYYLRSTWAGDNNYNSAISSSQTLDVVAPPLSVNLVQPFDRANITSSPILLQVSVTSGGSPVSGVTVEFYADGSSPGGAATQIGSSVTDSNGNASLTWTPTYTAQWQWYATAEKSGYPAATSPTQILWYIPSNDNLYVLPASSKSPSNSLLGQNTVFLSTSSQTITADPMSQISITIDYRIYSSTNPSEIDQLFLIASWTPSWPPPSGYYYPIYNGIPGTSPVTGSSTFNVDVPATFGTYYLWFCSCAHYSMEQAVGTYTQPLTTPAHIKIIVAHHDIGLTNIIPSKTVIAQGCLATIMAEVENQGDYTETFNVTAYANTTAIETKTVTLTNGAFTTVSFNWNTANLPWGNYTISAVADSVPGETNTTGNTLIDGYVLVTIPGDINGDRDVNILDIVKIADAYGTAQGQLNYLPNCDIDGDGDIDIIDIVIAAGHYGQSW
jgi:hypothetical protein